MCAHLRSVLCTKKSTFEAFFPPTRPPNPPIRFSVLPQLSQASCGNVKKGLSKKPSQQQKLCDQSNHSLSSSSLLWLSCSSVFVSSQIVQRFISETFDTMEPVQDYSRDAAAVTAAAVRLERENEEGENIYLNESIFPTKVSTTRSSTSTLLTTSVSGPSTGRSVCLANQTTTTTN